MKAYNTIIILNPQKDKLLFCKRMNQPYEGLFNFVGGKLEAGETSEEAAYRELFEETGITREDVSLHYFMDFRWHLQDMRMEVYAGILNSEVTLKEEKHPLCWLDFAHNFFDMNVFAGEGNLGHILEILKMSKEFFGPSPLTLEELREKGCLYVENIQEGMKNLDWSMKEGTKEEIREFLMDKIRENGWKNSFADFYYGRLSKEEQEKSNALLNKEQIEYLEKLYLRPEQLFFQLTPELFEITFQLSIKDALFSTFYFTKMPCTVWSNYERKFVVFRELKV